MIELNIKKSQNTGDLAHEYNPLRNQKDKDHQIVDFKTDELNVNLKNPVTIDCQTSYDGTVNLIINDDENPPRIINSRFTTLEDNKYKIITRNQVEQSNLYKVGQIDAQTRLFRNINKFPKLNLTRIDNYGKLKCGNYIFYIKYADGDGNLTDIVGESGVVSIFKGVNEKIESISGGLLDELSNKSISLTLDDIDITFTYVYIYFIRETSDLNGVRLTKAGKFTQGYQITGSHLLINLNGYEDVEDISPEEINIQLNTVHGVKTQAQVQNMLFFGNVQTMTVDVKELQNLSYYVNVALCRKLQSIGFIDEKYKV